jgi:serine-type anaerobic sulfatase-maturating enzyme
MSDEYTSPQQLGAPGSRSFHLMAKPGGSTCNLDCKYCFYLSKERVAESAALGLATHRLEHLIAQRRAALNGYSRPI